MPNQDGSSMERIPQFSLGEKGYIGLNQVSGQILEEMRTELRWPRNLYTYKMMSYDPIIKAANNIIDLMIGRINWSFVVDENTGDEAEKATEFLNYCMCNMEDQTWKDFINEVGSYRTYGFHVAEKVYTRVKGGKWDGKIKWKKLPTRSQDTINKFIFSDNGRKLLAIKQSTQHLSYGLNSGRYNGGGDITIPRSKIMLFRYDAKRDNPEGNSPLKGCYIPWKFKTLIEEYEAVGVAKDLGGIPVIGVDVDYLQKASADPKSHEASIVDTLQRDAANLHAGDKTFMILPLAYEDGKPLFDFKLVGVDGGL